MRAVHLSLILTLCLGEALGAEPHAKDAATASQLERQARTIDRAGRKSMMVAIQGLEKLISGKSTGKDEAADRILRLIDLRDELVQVNFRISAAAQGAARTTEARPWQDSLKALDVLISRFLGEHTDHGERHRIRLLRARTLEELALTQRARLDYELLLSELQDGPVFSAAVLALATLEAKDNHHEAAIRALKRLDARTEDSRWLLSRFKLVWSLHNLGRTPEIQNVYQNVLLQSQSWNAGQQEGEQASDTSLRDALWLDLAVFAAEAIDQGSGFGDLTALDQLFRKLTPGQDPGMGELRSRMQLRLGKLLRSQKRESELNEWITLATASAEDRRARETPRLIQVALEFLLQSWAGMTPARELARQEQVIRWIHCLAEHSESLTPAMEEIRQYLGDIQVAQLAAIRSEADPMAFAERLSDALTGLLPAGDARRIDIKKNLAESLFRVRRFDQAEAHYAAALEQAEHLGAKERVDDLWNRRLGARVEGLRKDGSIPKKLEAKAMQGTDSLATPATVLARIREARTWKARDPGLRLDLIRGIYQAGAIAEALEALEQELERDAATDIATAASALIVDTWIVSGDWSRTSETARRHLEIFRETEKNRAHLQHLRKVEAQASLKVLTARFDSLDSRENPEIRILFVATIQQWIQKHPDTDEEANARSLLARSFCLLDANSIQQCEKSISEWQQCLKKSGKGRDPSPLLLRAELALGRWQWEEAQKDLKEALSLIKQPGDEPVAPGSSEQVEKNISKIQSLLEGKSLSAEKTAAGIALQTLDQEPNGEKTYRKRLKAVRTLAREWKSLTEEERLPLMKPLARIIREKLPLLRTDIKKLAPLIASPKWIQWRIDAIREFESHLSTLGEGLPFVGIRVAVLNEIALASADLESDIGAIKFSRDTTAADREEVRQALAPLKEGMRSKVAALLEQSRALSREMGLAAEGRDLPDWSRILLPQGLPDGLVSLLKKITENGNIPGTSAVLAQARQKKLIDEALAIRIYSISLLKAGYLAESLKSWKGDS